MIIAPEIPSAKPYLLRAMYEWCCEQGLTPHVSVFVDHLVNVPTQFVKDHEITLNIGPDATGDLVVGNELIEFKARFGGVARQISVPITHVMAIYGRENGQGMAFPVLDVEEPSAGSPPASAGAQSDKSSQRAHSSASQAKPSDTKPILKRIK